MTSVSVFPSAPDPSHDISLSDGTHTYGFSFAGGPRVFQEIPLSAPAQAFDTRQVNFVGGKGRIYLADDAAGFFDSQGLWSTSEGYITTPLQWKYRLRGGSDEYLPTSTRAYQWLRLINYGLTEKRFLSTSFVAGDSVARDKMFLFIKKHGSPGQLRVCLCQDNSGSPGTILQSVIIEDTDVDDVISVFKKFDWTGTQAVTAGTTYHIFIAGADSGVNDYWSVLTDTTANGKSSSDGLSWSTPSSTTFTLYYRVCSGETARRFWYFELQGAKYAVSQNDSGSNSTILMNGFRGDASAATATTLTCSQTCSHSYADAYIKIIYGTGNGQIRKITSNTTGASVVFTVPTWDITPDTTSKFVVYGTEFWDVVTGTPGLGVVTSAPAVTDKIVYFPQGTSVAVRRMRVNGNSHDFADEASVKGDYLYYYDDNVWIADAGASKIAPAPVVAWGTALTAGTNVRIGSTAYAITNLYDKDGTFYIFKEDGPYSYNGTKVARIGVNFSNVPDPNNGEAVGNDGTYIWWSWGNSVERMLSSNVTDMLNWRSGYEGLPSDRIGKIVHILSVIGWMFFVVDGGSDNYSSIIVWNGYGWHEIFKSHETGQRIRDITWIPCQGGRPQLWFSLNGDLMYIEYPKNTSDPTRDTAVAYDREGVFITSTVDNGSIETYKIYDILRIFGKNNELTTSNIDVDYQVNEDVGTTNWTTLSFTKAKTIEVQIGEANQIRLRFRLIPTSPTTPPVISAWAISGREIPLAKFQYVGSYVAGTEMDTKTGESDDSSDTKYSWLIEAAVQQTPLTLRTLNTSSDSKVVTVSLPVKTADWVDEGNWGGRIAFALYEA